VKVKVKSRKSVKKRFKKRKSGSIKRAIAGYGHLLRKKSRRKKRKVKKGSEVSKGDAKRIKKLIF
jgi:large subunit ribosomal protein L35